MLNIERSMTADEILHELGHWLVATPRMREMPEFGLGMSTYNWTSDKHAVTTTSWRVSSDIEANASFVGITYAYALGFPWWDLYADDHNWHPIGDSWEELCFHHADTVTRLRRKNLLDLDNLPVVGRPPEGWPILLTGDTATIRASIETPEGQAMTVSSGALPPPRHHVES